MSDFELETEKLRARNRKLVEDMLGDVQAVIKKRVLEQSLKAKAKIRRPIKRAPASAQPRRTSARLVGKAPVDYSDAVRVVIGERSPSRRTRRTTRVRSGPHDEACCASVEAQEAAMQAAQAHCDTLDCADWKLFTPSIVGGGFWCDAPRTIKQIAAGLEFKDRRRHLTFLVDDDRYPVVLLDRGGFSGGWRKICIDKAYRIGDVGVFQWCGDDVVRLEVFRAADYE